MYRLDGKVALVTGAARKRGIGRAIALRLAREGANVVIVDCSAELLREEKEEGWQGLKSVVAEIEAENQCSLAIGADISLSQEVDQMVELSLSRFGKIDILVNNAGIALGGIDLVDLDEEQWKKVMAINLTGTFLCSKAVARSMIKRGEGGRIIIMSSRSGRQGAPGWGAYSVSKFGLIGLTQILAQELAPYKINVNAICPASISTDMDRVSYPGLTWRETLEKATTERVHRILLGRLGTPEDVANVAAFLAGSETDYMTGQAINITGGQQMD